MIEFIKLYGIAFESTLVLRLMLAILCMIYAVCRYSVTSNGTPHNQSAQMSKNASREEQQQPHKQQEEGTTSHQDNDLLYLPELKEIQSTHTFADRVIFFRDTTCSIVQSPFSYKTTIELEEAKLPCEIQDEDPYEAVLSSSQFIGFLGDSPHRRRTKLSTPPALDSMEQHLTIARCHAWSQDSLDT